MTALGQAPECQWDWSLGETSGTVITRWSQFQRGNWSSGGWNCFLCVTEEMCVSVSYRAYAMGIKHLFSQYQSADFSIRHSFSPWLGHDTSLLLFCLSSITTWYVADVLCLQLWKTKPQSLNNIRFIFFPWRSLFRKSFIWYQTGFPLHFRC